jgi:hypothetical protein
MSTTSSATTTRKSGNRSAAGWFANPAVEVGSEVLDARARLVVLRVELEIRAWDSEDFAADAVHEHLVERREVELVRAAVLGEDPPAARCDEIEWRRSIPLRSSVDRAAVYEAARS